MNKYYLFDDPSFLEGCSRALDLGGTFDSYNVSTTPEEADNIALASDWKAVGNDLRTTLNNAKEEFKK